MIVHGKKMSLEDLMQRRTRETVWIAYSEKYPYLPIAVADSAEGLAKIVGVKPKSVERAWNDFFNRKTKSTRYACVLIEE